MGFHMRSRVEIALENWQVSVFNPQGTRQAYKLQEEALFAYLQGRTLPGLEGWNLRKIAYQSRLKSVMDIMHMRNLALARDRTYPYIEQEYE